MDQTEGTISSSPPRGRAYSFRAILSVTVIAAILPTLLFSGILLLRYAESERARAERGLIESTRAIARAIDARFIAAESALLALRDSPFLDNGDLAAFEERLRRTSNETRRYFSLVDPSGQQLINTMFPPGQPLSKNPPSLWAAVFKDRRTHVTDVLTGVSTGRLLAAVGVPVMRGGNVRWVLAAELFEEDFARLMDEPGVPRDWIVSIVDRTGRHIVRSHNNAEFAGKFLVPALIEQMRRGRTATLRTTSLEGIPLISNVQYAPRSQWAAAVGLPVASLEAPMRQSLYFLLGSGILVAVAALFLAFLVARLLVRAMTSLTLVAEHAGRGEVVDPPRTPVAEANAVGEVLGRASRDLHDLTTSLEAQVAARTAELSGTNVRLMAEMQRRQESEARVMQMQKIEAIGQLTGGIAHDFNNMLAIVLSSLRLMQRRLQRGDTNVQQYIDGAVQGAERAASLTSRLLAFSRQQPLAPEAIDANKLVAGMGDILRRTIPENVQIETVLAGGLWRTFADAQGLENAIINLTVNGRDAMPDGGKLTIETANVYLDEAYAAQHADVSPGQYVMVAVTDTGTGMPPEVVSRVFDPFFTTKPAGSGTGLGLSQVHGFITQSGGHVAIYTEPSLGTTIKLYLPRLSGDSRAATTERSLPTYPARSTSGETILVVEDDADVRRLTVEMLQDMGYVTLEADDGKAALRELDANPGIALLFTDVVMPGMNGRQLADEALQKRPELKVLYTTGYTRNAIVHHGVLDPDVHVLIKPHTYEALANKVSELLRSRSSAGDRA